MCVHCADDEMLGFEQYRGFAAIPSAEQGFDAAVCWQDAGDADVVVPSVSQMHELMQANDGLICVLL